MTRTGKIARLPRAVRDELNRRLREGETGVGLVVWLNRQPEVRRVLDGEFGGRPINEQNLSEWKTGGYAEWQGRQELLEDAREMTADARELYPATDGRLADHLAAMLAVRYASVLRKWNGEVSAEVSGQLKLLHGLCADVAELRRGDHGSLRVDLEQKRLDQAREKTEADIFLVFDRWSKTPGLRDLLCKDWVCPEERERALRASFGLPPLPRPEVREPEVREQRSEVGEQKSEAASLEETAGRQPKNQGGSKRIKAQKQKLGEQTAAVTEPMVASPVGPALESDRTNGSDGSNGTDGTEAGGTGANGGEADAGHPHQGESSQIKALDEDLGQSGEIEKPESGNLSLEKTVEGMAGVEGETSSNLNPADYSLQSPKPILEL